MLETGDAFWTADYLHDPRLSGDFTDAVRAAGLVGELAVPVRVREELVGVLWAFWTARRPHRRARRTATDLAQVVAIAVENARLYEDARDREAEALALFEVGRLISATLDPDRVLDLIVEKVRDLMDVPACGIFRARSRRSAPLRAGCRAVPGFTRGLIVRLGEGTSGRSMAERRPVWTRDILTTPPVRDAPVRRLVEKEGYHGALSVPILKGAPFGCLATYWWEPHEPTPARSDA